MRNDDGAASIDHAGYRHECVDRNYAHFLQQNFAFPAPDVNAEAAPDVSSEDLLHEFMSKGKMSGMRIVLA